MGSQERRLRERQQRIDGILDAARNLLMHKGLNATSVHEIAELSELSVGSIYFYFKNKEEIFAALQEEGIDILYESIKSVTEGDESPEKKLRQICAAYLSFSREYNNYFDIINYFLSSSEIVFAERLKNRIDQHGNMILSLVGGCIEEGMASGLFKKVDSRRYSILIWGSLHGIIQLRKLKNTILKGDDFDDLFSFTVDQIMSPLIK